MNTQIISKPNDKYLSEKDICFPVEKVETSSLNNGLKTANNEHQFTIVGYPNNEKTILNYVAKGYELTPNSEIFPRFSQSLIDLGIDFETNVRHINNSKFYVGYKFLRAKKFIGCKKDTITLGFEIQNGYFKLPFAGYTYQYRQICSNGLWGQSKEFEMKGKHTISINEKISAMVEFVQNLIPNFENQCNQYEVLAQRNFDIKQTNERIEQIAEKTGAINKKAQIELVLTIVNKEMDKLALDYSNDWLVYNAINNVIFNDSLNVMHPEFRIKKDQQVFNFILENKLT